MNIDTYTFFQIILSGFMLVWSFRKFSHSRSNISDFEYLGFSSFWGIIIALTYYWLYRNQPEIIKVFNNPLATGIVLSIFGFLIGFIVGKLAKLSK